MVKNHLNNVNKTITKTSNIEIEDIKELYDWLIITINIGLFQEYFYEICTAFGDCIKNDSVDFKRIFVVLENQNPLLRTDYLWDSWYDRK